MEVEYFALPSVVVVRYYNAAARMVLFFQGTPTFGASDACVPSAGTAFLRLRPAGSKLIIDYKVFALSKRLPRGRRVLRFLEGGLWHP